jgi:hypothetical protein
MPMEASVVTGGSSSGRHWQQHRLPVVAAAVVICSSGECRWKQGGQLLAAVVAGGSRGGRRWQQRRLPGVAAAVFLCTKRRMKLWPLQHQPPELVAAVTVAGSWGIFFAASGGMRLSRETS